MIPRRGGTPRVVVRGAQILLEARTLIALAVLSALGWAFVELADEVLEGETQTFDRLVMLALRNPNDPADPIGPPWAEEIARDLTALGGIGILTLMTVAVAVFLVLLRRRGDAMLVLVSVLGGTLATTLFKRAFDRPRPDLVPHDSAVYTASFPSGHSMMAAVVYLTLGALLAEVQGRRVLKVYLMSVALVLTLLVGITRVYLGVHWPTDVLAGWTAGAAWALACWTVARLLHNSGTIASVASDPEAK